MKKEFEKRLLSSAILLPLSFFFIIEGSILLNFFLLACLLLSSHEWFKMTKGKKYHLIGHIFLFFSFYSAYALRNDFGQNSLLFFLFIIAICISTDIGGYIFGKILKGPKLTIVSPNKTYAGVIGGYIFSVISIKILFNYTELFVNNLEYFFDINILFLVLIISTISQIGDITVSYFKRLSKIKNTGKIIPGHGGILDRVDGMIFAFPFSYLIICTILNLK